MNIELVFYSHLINKDYVYVMYVNRVKPNDIDDAREDIEWLCWIYDTFFIIT